jgi:hypothetical protein
MNNALTRALVGSAVLLACGQVNAATLTQGANKVIYSSTQGNAAAAAANGAASVELQTLTVNVGGSGYTDTDVVTVTVGGAQLRQAAVGTVGGTTVGREIIECKSGGNTQFKLNLKSVTGSKIEYTVSDRVNTPLAANTTCALPALDLLASSLTSTAAVTLNWSAATASGAVHDVMTDGEGNPAQSAEIHYALTQFAVGCASNSGGTRSSTCASNIANTLTSPTGGTSADGVSFLPVGSTFLTAASSTTASNNSTQNNSATFFARITDDRTGWLGVANSQNLISGLDGSQAVTYTGDFSFLDNNSNGCTTTDFGSGFARFAVKQANVDVTTTSATISADCKTITVTGTSNRTDELIFTVNATPTGNGAKAIAEQTIVAATTFKKAGTTLASTSGSVGFISASGASYSVAYMPYGSGISRIIYATNRTSTPGQVLISARNEAGTSCSSTNFPRVTLPASGVALLSAAADEGVAKCFGAGFTGKVAFTITPWISGGEQRDSVTLSIPLTTGSAKLGDNVATTATGVVSRATAKVDVYSAYNVNGNRVTVINTSNGR